MRKSWYAEGLRFSCRRCGSCCRGEPGYVFVNAADVERIAAFLGIAAEDFRKEFTREAEGKLSLLEETDGRCGFFTEKGCRIYGVRPAQCRTFPFWEWNIASRSNWRSVSLECPGMGSGRLFAAEEILAILRSRDSAGEGKLDSTGPDR